MDNQPIRQKDFEEWLGSPVTRALLEALKEHSDATRELVSECMLNIKRLKDIDIEGIAEYRGNLRTLEQVSDLQSFLEDRVELTKEVTYEEDTTSSDGG